MKTLAEICKHEGDKYGEDCKAYPKLYPRDDFNAGFNAGVRAHKEITKGLIEALEKFIVDEDETAEFYDLTEALEEYKKRMGK